MRGVIVTVGAVVVVGAVVWAVVNRLRGSRPDGRGPAKPAAQPESAQWRQRARALYQRGQEIVRDLDPAIVLADGAPESREMRISWVNRSVSAAREFSAPVTELSVAAATLSGAAAATTFADRLDQLAEAGEALAHQMDDAHQVERLAAAHTMAETALSGLRQLM